MPTPGTNDAGKRGRMRMQMDQVRGGGGGEGTMMKGEQQGGRVSWNNAFLRRGAAD